MTAAPITALTWPPAADPRPRWVHLILHAIADVHLRTWHAHQQLTGLRDQAIAHPPEPGTLAPRIRTIDHTAVDLNDWAHLHQILNQHDLALVARLLVLALDHPLDAVLTLRRLAEADERRWLDRSLITPRLEQADDDLATAGLLIVRADAQLINALEHRCPEPAPPRARRKPSPTTPAARPTAE